MSPVHSLHLQGQVGVHCCELVDRDAVGEVSSPRDTERALDLSTAFQGSCEMARTGPKVSVGPRLQKGGLPRLVPKDELITKYNLPAL